MSLTWGILWHPNCAHSLTHSLTHKPGLRASGGFFGDLRFPLLFSILLLSSLAIVYLLPEIVQYKLREMTSIGAIHIANLLGLSAFAEPGNIISIEGQRLSIISECTALSYILIFASAVIAYPYALKKKAVGLLICLPVIVLLNLLRIVFLGWLGGHYHDYFNLFHDYLWEGGFLLVVMLIWMVWVNSFTAETERRREKTSPTLWEGVGASKRFSYLEGMRGSLILISSFIIAYMLSGQYMKLLAHASNYLLHVLAVGGGAISTDGKALSLISGKTFYELSMGIYYFLPFIILTLLFSRGSAFRSLMTGIPLLFLIHSAAAVAAFFALLNDSGDGMLMIISTIETISPVVVWFLQRRSNDGAGFLKLKTENF